MSTIEKAAARMAQQKAAKADAQKRAEGDTGSAARTVGNTSGNEASSRQSNSATGNASNRQFSRVRMPGRHCELDLQKLAKEGFITPDGARNQISHDFRRIKRPLLLNMQQKVARAGVATEPASNLVMVTSALPGEGKTFVTINLAMSLAAELDKNVLIVDGDIAKGDISKVLGVDGDVGLADLLQDNDAQAEDAVMRTNVERLSLLPAGRYTDRLDELFASELMDDIVRRLAAEDPNRIVLFDAPPLLVTTEGAVLAGYMGQIVMVVEANRTPKDALEQAINQVSHCQKVSLLLNKTQSSAGSLYGYGYGYGYGAHADGALLDGKNGQELNSASQQAG